MKTTDAAGQVNCRKTNRKCALQDKIVPLTNRLPAKPPYLILVFLIRSSPKLNKWSKKTLWYRLKVAHAVRLLLRLDRHLKKSVSRPTLIFLAINESIWQSVRFSETFASCTSSGNFYSFLRVDSLNWHISISLGTHGYIRWGYNLFVLLVTFIASLQLWNFTMSCRTTDGNASHIRMV